MSYPQQPYTHPATQRKTSGLAIASLVLGLVGFISCGLTSILSVIFGHVALGQIRRDRTDGHGMALAGTVLGWILTGAWLLFWVLWWAGIVGSIGLSAVTEPSARVPIGVLQSTQPTGDPAAQVATFEATGQDGATSAGNVTSNVGLEIAQDSGVPLPYTKEVPAASGTKLYLWVQNAGTQGTVTCRIKVGGQVLREAVSTGPYGVCTVSATLP